MGNLTALLKSKTARAVLLLLTAAVLLLCAWRVFGGSGQSYEPTEREARLAGLLEEVGGIASARALISEEGGKAVSAVVIFEGEDSILLRGRILDIASAALGLPKEKVQVYPARK